MTDRQFEALTSRLDTIISLLLRQPDKPATTNKKGGTRLVNAEEAAKRLGMATRTFRNSWARRFTDRRPIECRSGRGQKLMILEDELDVAVGRGWEALAEFRSRAGRK